MANNSIIQHMMNVLDQYEVKALPAGQVAMFLDEYAHVLEGISSETLVLVRQAAAQLVKSDEESSGPVSAAAALEQLRAQVLSLLGESSNPDILVRAPQAGS
ncbi:MAG: hypothetical protein FIA96_11290 [Betaproteobacteria bacterium]|nr:hypothetical protein [Betaproteobacteria bacterium]